MKLHCSSRISYHQQTPFSRAGGSRSISRLLAAASAAQGSASTSVSMPSLNSPPTSTTASSASSAQNASSATALPGPAGAFSPGQESETRQKLFNRIAPVYDELNSRLSLGQHWVWKRMTVKWSRAKAGHRVVDLCCGSGDVSLLLADVVGPQGQVIGLDFAEEMLQDAALRAESRALKSDKPVNVQWTQGDALQLPFDDNSFDAATMSYGLRNVADIPRALREMLRVLTPGATVSILDFNNSTNPLVDGLQGWALENVVVPAARSYGMAAEYEYLRPSIKSFPTGRQQQQMALEAGFASAVHYEIGFGLMGVLVATKAASPSQA